MRRRAVEKDLAVTALPDPQRDSAGPVALSRSQAGGLTALVGAVATAPQHVTGGTCLDTGVADAWT
jgi:hypothetical protein